MHQNCKIKPLKSISRQQTVKPSAYQYMQPYTNTLAFMSLVIHFHTVETYNEKMKPLGLISNIFRCEPESHSHVM